MNVNLHLTFNGNCREAFAFYSELFQSPIVFTMKYSDAPNDFKVADEDRERIMHTAMKLGQITLMGADQPSARTGGASGGYEISLDTPDEAELRRIFDALSQDGHVVMPLKPTFWTSLFGMLQDRFGVHWMLGLTGENPAS